MMKTKFTRILATFLCLALFVSFGTSIFGNLGILNVGAEGIALDLFRSYGMNVDLKMDGGESYISITSQSDYTGSKQPAVEFTREFAGEFSMEFEYASSANSVYYFTVGDENTSFNIYMEYSAGKLNTYVEYMGKKSGMNYNDQGLLIGNSLAMNSNGAYTAVDAVGKIKVTFDAATMTVSIADETKTREVWSFAGDYCDGIAVDNIEPFKNYKVKMGFNTVGDPAEIKVFEVNDAFIGNGKISSDAKPGVYAEVEYSAIGGEKYTVPAPAVSDLISNDISVDVLVENDKGVTTMMRTAYADGLSFDTNAADAYYLVKYIVTNTLGNTTIYELKVNNYASEDAMKLDYSYGFDMPSDEEFGLNTTINIPTAKLTGDLYTSNAGKATVYDVYYNGVLENDCKNISADKITTLKLEKEGRYTIVFKEANGLVAMTEAFEYVVKADIVSLELPVFNTSAQTYDVLNVPTGYWVNGDIRQEANSKIIFPSGACYSNTEITYEEAGLYEIVYYGTVDGKYYEQSRYITVFNSPKSIFVEDGVSEFVWGTSNLTNKVSGVKVYTKNATTVRYSEIIDLKDYTRKDTLIELMADVTTPGSGSTDFTQFVITLTDIYDESNVLTIQCNYSTTTNGHGNGTYVKAGGKNQQLAGLYDNYVHTDTGYQVAHSFQGLSTFEDISKNTLPFYFDYSSLTLYSGTTWGPGLDARQDYVVSKFGDASFYAIPWEGFTTGEVYLDITVNGATKGTIGYTVLGIAKQDFSSASELSDNLMAPKLTVEQTDFPDALKGFDYKIPEATAKDSINGELDVTKKVFFRYGTSSQAEMVIANGTFKPVYEGEYTIVYSATDRFGLTTTNEYTINVIEVGADIEFTLDDNRTAFNIDMGGVFIFPQVSTIENAYGKTSTEISISDAGGNIEHNSVYLKPSAVGDYTIKYTVTDYHGRKADKTITLKVMASEKPVLENTPVFPNAFVAGSEYIFNVSSATDYATDTNGVAVAPKIYIDGTLISGGRYTPAQTADTTVKVKYEYVGSKKTVTFEQDVPVIVALNDGKYDFTKFFVSDYTTTIDESGIFFDVQNSGKISFAKEVSTDGFRVDLLFKTVLGTDESITLTLTDPLTGAKEVNAVITYSNGFKVSFNNGKPISISSDVDENGNTTVAIYYNYKNNSWYDRNDIYLGGFEFEHMNEMYTEFMNETAILTMDVQVFTAKALGVYKVNNQNFTSQTARDRVAPELRVADVGGLFEIDHVLTIPAASAFDLLSGVASLQVSVLYNNKPIEAEDGTLMNAVDATKEYTIKLSQYGSYSINYITTDVNGNKVAAIKQAAVSDFEAPEITVADDAYSSAYKLGSTVNIAKPTVTDNLDEEVAYAVYIICSNGEFIAVTTESYVFDTAGAYCIRYLAIDDDGNMGYKDFDIRVQ